MTSQSFPVSCFLVSRFCTPPEVKIDAFDTSKQPGRGRKIAVEKRFCYTYQYICTLTLNGYPGTVNTHPLSTLRRRNLKRMFITLTTHQMFSVHTSLEKFENATLDLCSRKSWRNRFGKAPFWKCFPSTLKLKAYVFKFLGFQQCFRLESARFRGKLLWTEDLTVEMKLLKLFTGR